MVPVTAPPPTSVLAEASKFKHISSVLQMFLVTDLSWDDNEGDNLVLNHEGDTKHLPHFSGQARNQKLT